MSIPTGHKTNLSTLIKAASNGHLALVECTDAVTKKTVIAVCAISTSRGANGKPDYQITPLAKMFDGNPYEEILPPA